MFSIFDQSMFELRDKKHFCTTWQLSPFSKVLNVFDVNFSNLLGSYSQHCLLTMCFCEHTKFVVNKNADSVDNNCCYPCYYSLFVHFYYYCCWCHCMILLYCQINCMFDDYCWLIMVFCSSIIRLRLRMLEKKYFCN